WFFGALVLSQLPVYTKHVLHGDESVVTLLLAIFSVAIGIGSILTEKLSRGRVELGIVPIGAFFLTVFTADLYFIDYGAIVGSSLVSARDLFTGDVPFDRVRLLVDFTMMGMSFAIFMVPLFALIQLRSDAD